MSYAGATLHFWTGFGKITTLKMEEKASPTNQSQSSGLFA